MPDTPDLAGLSLGGAYQAGLQAGFENFQILAYRATWMIDPSYLFREVAPAAGYVAQTSAPGSGGAVLDTTPPDGSFYTEHPEPGVPDQYPEPGEPVTAGMTLSFVYQVSDTQLAPTDTSRSGVDPMTGVTAWWEYDFAVGGVPGTLAADLALYNGKPLPAVDVSAQDWLEVATDPLRVFSAPPVPEPADLLEDVPQFERQSYEIQTVLRVVANELARIEAAQAGLVQNYFPMSADLLLPRWEQLLGLPVGPSDPEASWTEDFPTRRGIVMAYLQALRTEGRGLDWIAAITALCGNSWNYAEHDPAVLDSPPPYCVAVNIPTVLARVGWKLVRDVTPAHIDMTTHAGYIEAWLVGVSLLDIDPL